MRRTLLLLVGSVPILAMAACTGTVTPTASAPASTAPTSAPISSGSTSESPPGVVVPSPTPVLPAAVPATYPRDLPAGDVPLRALIPPGTQVDGSWYATTPAGEAILVAFARPGDDPFRAERGFVVWRRLAQDPPWVALYGVVHPAEEGVVSTRALLADLTGDGSPDALVNEVTGGSGTCGIWRVVELATGTEVWNRTLCDAQVLPSADPIGIEITEAVFEAGDAHCCPSGTRTTVLVYRGEARWTVVSKVVTPTR